MRKLRNYFVMLTVAIMALFGSSCGSDDSGEEDLGPFFEYSNPETFYDIYNSYTGEKVLIDYREKSKYDAGHLTGAINMPATVYNTSSDDAAWCKELLAAFPTSTRLYFYGTSSFEMNKTVAGRASRLGYGKEHSFIFTKGYDGLKSIWK